MKTQNLLYVLLVLAVFSCITMAGSEIRGPCIDRFCRIICRNNGYESGHCHRWARGYSGSLAFWLESSVCSDDVKVAQSEVPDVGAS
ncbi:hypothetical protein GCK72_000236 [Caenorhabditis remanei]|uniref:Uncharacterized protein n=1 Tax=Caenorhabditis remanei TaxID=31234 RepID=A0A6A5HPB1_CAERE|nr:hypothetical protein GCK72_000236 [Caenorhabditis remanei]KAF1768424.1 hypothetical protein GCK72_000236 [Caenorhabditis remanei]